MRIKSNKCDDFYSNKYKILHLYSQEGVKKPGEASNLIAELTVSNAERENHRLKQYIASLEKELDGYRGKGVPNAPVLDNKRFYLSSEDSSAANLKKALNMLI